MIDEKALAARLRTIGLDDWPDAVFPLIRERLSPRAHGDFERWRLALQSLETSAENIFAVREALQRLAPWRKGPFDLGGVHVDAEWRSDLKWKRLENAITPLTGRNVLDVGCGNGYYALQMRRAGATAVIGLDPTLLYVMQFLAINHFVADRATFVLPLRLHEVPAGAGTFDTTFSMGVLYHQRSPLDHLRQLRDTLRPGGQLVLETIFLPGEEPFARTPPERYARMKNVWLLPTIPELTTWLARTGFRDVAVVDTTLTSTDEQRKTEWMRFESLADALDPADPSLTVEGWPAPRRVVVLANRPAA